MVHKCMYGAIMVYGVWCMVQWCSGGIEGDGALYVCAAEGRREGKTRSPYCTVWRPFLVCYSMVCGIV